MQFFRAELRIPFGGLSPHGNIHVNNTIYWQVTVNCGLNELRKFDKNHTARCLCVYMLEEV